MHKFLLTTALFVSVVFVSMISIFPALALAASPVPKYVLINSINWQSLDNLPLQDGSEFTYFTLHADSNGVLSGANAASQTKFVNDVHAAGKKATFSVGGGTQNVAAITTAVNNVSGLVNGITSHVTQFGYDGVTLNIENTSIDPQKMADFVIALRASFDAVNPALLIGIDVQNYQRTTVWSKLDQYVHAVNWVAPMLYDSGKFRVSNAIAAMNAWTTEVPKEKLLVGLAVNYPVNNGGVRPSEYAQILDFVIANSFAGVAIWNNALYTEPWIDVARSKIIP